MLAYELGMTVVECRKKISWREAQGWVAYFREKAERELEEKKTNSLTDYYLMQNTMELRLLRSQWSKRKIKVKFEDFLLEFKDNKKEKEQDDLPFDQNSIRYASRLKAQMPDIEAWQQSLTK